MFGTPNVLFGRLFNWRQGDEEDTWRNKAIDVLLKKVNRANQTENLKLALHVKRENTPCVTLDRSKDGRLQVMHRKMLPHVMYCRIFRWPDLQSQHELRSVSSCQWPAHIRELHEICVNPYHYTRVDHSNYPPVVSQRNNNEFAQASPPPYSPMSSGSNYSPSQQSPPYPSQPTIQTPTQQGSPHDLYNSNQPLGLTTYQTSQPPAVQSNGWYGQTISLTGGTPSDENMQPTRSDAWVRSPPFPGYSALDRENMSIPMDIIDDSQPGGAVERNHWCRIFYFELNQKVGAPFTSSARLVTVNGFTDPEHPNRFSLGHLPNPTRSKPIEQICNIENQLNQHTVIKIEPGNRQKMFDHKIFEDLLHEALRSQDGQTFERLHSLLDHCVIKMSFVKGWGSIYKRQDVTSTPCWIEIQLLKYYTLIDQYLPEVKPSSQITSRS